MIVVLKEDNMKELIKDISKVFIPPKKVYYIGKIAYGAPYYYPWNFNKSIISFRKLKPKSPSEYEEYIKKYDHLKSSRIAKFNNVPMVRRCNYRIWKIFNQYYYVQFGYPIKYQSVSLGWKEKWGTPRFEYAPQKHLYIFNWQISIFWNAPDGDNDKYYEQYLWYRYYTNGDINQAKRRWPWRNHRTNISSWIDKYVKKLNENV